ncbi:MAG TPA: hypothetical protein IGS53_16725 [Leptolyngbyaceae cyanobacterium M33_DOE_097]|uniref:Uncharacterized protein n=1 Tax=Oscillatoriales cyanobacterium SpSt-418 TaxID=2282169 RepID=A0A7C3KIM5_9CYAN|nr:hypothetical protein [Leptolyngbyaceae cyanobacterium M33_DOE_097]
MKLNPLVFGVALAIVGLTPLAAKAQQSANACVVKASASDSPGGQITNLSRAKNLARQAAEEANGGIGVYRAEASMHGSIGQTPCTPNENGTWTFTFTGGAPGEAPTVESAVTVNPSNWEISVDYNGPIRPSAKVSE